MTIRLSLMPPIKSSILSASEREEEGGRCKPRADTVTLFVHRFNHFPQCVALNLGASRFFPSHSQWRPVCGSRQSCSTLLCKVKVQKCCRTWESQERLSLTNLDVFLLHLVSHMIGFELKIRIIMLYSWDWMNTSICKMQPRTWLIF